jgi:hypothetical protein
MKRLFVLLMFCAVSVPAAGAAGTLSADSLKAGEVTVEALQGRVRGLFFGMKWEESGKSCTASQSGPRQPRKWKPIPAENCAALRKELLASGGALEGAALADPAHVPLDYGPTTGVLSVQRLKIPVNLMTSESCDASFEHCKAPKLDAASALARDLRARIANALAH